VTEADEKVQRLLVKLFRDGRGETQGVRGTIKHLRECATTQAEDVDGGDSFYGCDTGCEYVRLKASIRCKCGRVAYYEYNEFGDMEGLFYDMDHA